MEKILHHQRCPKTIFQPHKKRVSGITSGAGFFPSTVWCVAVYTFSEKVHGLSGLKTKTKLLFSTQAQISPSGRNQSWTCYLEKSCKAFLETIILR